MKEVFLVSVAILSVFSEASSSPLVPLSAVVNTTYGPVRGEAITLKTNKSLVQYLGIPFAQAGRFEAPKPPKKWNSTRNATSFGKSCPQKLSAFFVNNTKDIDEDCLSVNVFVPQNEATRNKLYAVMVWIYGGGFIVGNSAFYNGAFLATEGEVVVVTFNYRVGGLGFLSTGTSDIPGNFGLLDQVQALHWVRENIERFGGDPNKVTLFGQSAGAASVALHMLSPLSYGLYQQVILESGTATVTFAEVDNASAIETTKSFAKLLGCEMSGLKACLQSKNVSEILKAQQSLPPYSFLPTVDHNFLKGEIHDPSTLLNKGEFNQTVPAMIGVTKNEGGFFVSPANGIYPGIPGIDKGINKTFFDELVKKGKWVYNQNDEVVNSVIFQYTDWSNQTNPLVIRQEYIDVITDAKFKAPAVHSAKVFIENKMKTFFYRFDHFVPIPKLFPPWAGVIHCADTIYVFGRPYMGYHNKTSDNDTEIAFSKSIMTMWSNFAKSGDPTPDGQPIKWPEFSLQDQPFAALAPTSSIQKNMLPEKMAFWNSYVPSLTQPNPNTTQVPIVPTQVSTRPTVPPTGQKEASVDKGAENALIGVVVVLGVLLLVLLFVLWRFKRKLGNAMSEPGPTTRLI